MTELLNWLADTLRESLQRDPIACVCGALVGFFAVNLALLVGCKLYQIRRRS